MVVRYPLVSTPFAPPRRTPSAHFLRSAWCRMRVHLLRRLSCTHCIAPPDLLFSHAPRRTSFTTAHADRFIMITYLHHTDPELPHYRQPEWNFQRGAAATVDRNFLGWMGRFFLHDVAHYHVIHHFFPKMPFCQ